MARGRGRPTKSLEDQIHSILESYVEDVITGTNAAIDKGATLCKQKVVEDSPESDKDLIRYRHGNALVEKALDKKDKKKYGYKVHKKGSYKKGWRVVQDSARNGKQGMLYGKRIKNTKYPHLTHHLENGHRLVDSEGNEIGKVDHIPHIEQNGADYGERAQAEIDKFLKKGKSYD
jgi:hypothetical protein